MLLRYQKGGHGGASMQGSAELVLPRDMGTGVSQPDFHVQENSREARLLTVF